MIFYTFSSWSSFPDSAVYRIHTLQIHLSLRPKDAIHNGIRCGILKAGRLTSVRTQILLSWVCDDKMGGWGTTVFHNPVMLIFWSSSRRKVPSWMMLVTQYSTDESVGTGVTAVASFVCPPSFVKSLYRN